MNSYGLSILLRMGCLCTRETITVNGTKYTVVDNIAQGGFSLIDLVENRTTRKRYAVKRITCHSLEDQNNALHEVELHKSVEHANVIKLYDYALTGNADIVLNTISHVNLILPFYKNGSLEDNLRMRARNRDHMPEGHVLQIFIGICDGLKAFHEAKPEPLAHRDLKTANICMSDSMEPIIVDLGSATLAREQICGQPDAQRLQDQAEERCSIVYRAPELFNVQSYCMIDERTDIWSLGCVLFALCFFRSPFDSTYEKGDSVALAVLSGNIPFPEDSPYSSDMHELVLYMMRINMMERPYIYSVIEKANDLIAKLEQRV